MDSQWPRYQVFQQERPAKPHQAIGTVHAADPEMALLNARMVYARRPAWHTVWIAPFASIFARSTEELAADDSWRAIAENETGENRRWAVFVKRSQRRSMVATIHIGEVAAATKEGALAAAIDEFDDGKVWVWWVLPTDDIVGSEESDQDSWFEPIKDKKYRQQAYYGFVAGRRAKRGRKSKLESNG